MKILVLEPYYGGSHKAFLDGWQALTRHDWTLLTLGANKWKWRMRIAAITFADQSNELVESGYIPDMIFCSDMLNVAEFKGLANPRLKNIPLVVYFHENQITYPKQIESDRDYQFVATNMTTALATDAVWFNSEFHRGEFLDALANFIKIIPNDPPKNVIERIAEKSTVNPPGISMIDRPRDKKPGPMRILWAGRWEHDKNPEDFFAALKVLKEKQIDFRLSVIGENYRNSPEVFAWAKDHFADNIDCWGYQESRSDYEKALCDADIIVSTANHEFFGISVVEAIAAGAYPILPNRLAYPEIVARIDAPDKFLYDGTVKALTRRLFQVAKAYKEGKLWQSNPQCGKIAMRTFEWKNLVSGMDEKLQELCK
ncbi:MAG: DUF3524 domain-containing protein [Planctomycetes bacterium]|nr:DUF3524 domain-containing protein [Planctomycetota bacterium]